MRVLTMSSGCTARVAMVPAERPATVSTRAGERPASLVSVIETPGSCRYMGPVGCSFMLLWLFPMAAHGECVVVRACKRREMTQRVQKLFAASFGRTKPKGEGSNISEPPSNTTIGERKEVTKMQTVSQCPNHHPLELVRYYNVQLWSWYPPPFCPSALLPCTPRSSIIAARCLLQTGSLVIWLLLYSYKR